MVRMIAMRGRLKGSARLELSGGKTSIKVNAAAERSAPAASAAYLISRNRIVRVELGELSGKGDIDDVRAVILVDDGGSIISEGSSGMNATLFERAKVRIRLDAQSFSVNKSVHNAAKTDDKQPGLNAESAQKTSEKQANGAQANVTKRILSQAKQLFGSDLNYEAGESHSGTEDAAASENNSADMIEQTENPFPAQFPNSMWLIRSDGSLYGKCTMRGRHYAVNAYPLGKGKTPAWRGAMRKLRAIDGRMYAVIVKLL